MRSVRSLGCLHALCMLAAVHGAQAQQAPEAGAGDGPATVSKSRAAPRATAPQDSFAHEPSVHEVLEMALEAARRAQADLSAMSTRARLSGLVPELSLSARHGQGLDLTQANTQGGQVRVGNDTDLTLYASLTFDLPRLVFARDEIAIDRQQRLSHQDLRALADATVALYFERRRLQVQQASGRGESDTGVRILELTARLDVFTEGEFSRILDARKGAGPHPARRSDHP